MDSISIFSCRHAAEDRGLVDQTNRQFLPAEFVMAERLAQEGHRVTSLREGSDEGKVGDADVCGHKTEFKRFSGVGTAAPEDRIRERLSASRGQGTHTIIDASPDTRITAADADRGVRNFLPIEARHEARGSLKGSKKIGIRVYGQDYDLSYDHSRLQEMRREQSKPQQQSVVSKAPQQEEPQPQSNKTPAQDPNQDQPRSRFAIERSEEPSAERDSAANRFQIAKGDEGSSRRRGPTK